MTTRLLALIALTLAAPLTAQAQAAGSLGSPVDPVVVPTGYGAQAYLPQAPTVSLVGPEIVRFRVGAAPQLQWQDRVEPEAATGPSFGASWGHSWAGFGIGVGGGAILGGVAASITCSDDGFGGCTFVGMLGAGLGAMAGGPLGSALATWGFGEGNGGTGNFFAALGGSYLGAGLGVGVSALLGAAGQGGFATILGPIIGVFASTLGAAAGYQLSSHGTRSETETASNDPVVVPTLAPTENGATIGVAGMF